MGAGYIYLLVNSSMVGLVKIGKTERQPSGRADELSLATGVPTPFVVGYNTFVNDCDEAERLIHQHLATFRANARREFFQVSATDAIHVIQTVCGELNAQTPTVSLPDRGDETSAIPGMPNRMTALEQMRGQTRRYERLGPIVAGLRKRIQLANQWTTFVENIDRDGQRLRELSPEFLWSEVSKAARTASTVSLRAHDQLLEMEEPLRQITLACRKFQDSMLRNPFSYSGWSDIRNRLRVENLDWMVDELKGQLGELIPKLQSTCDNLLVFVPALLNESSGGSS